MTTKLTNTTVDGPIERQFAYDPANTSGSTFAVKAGILNEGNISTSIPASTVTLATSAITKVYINLDSNTIASQSGVLTANALGLFEVTTDGSGAITNIKDIRSRLISS